MDLYKDYELDTWIGELIDILKGNELPLDFFYESKSGYSDLDALSNEMADALPAALNEQERGLYLHFFAMAISFLESCCNYEDKLVKNIKLLSTVVFSSDNKRPIFQIMIENHMDSGRNKTEKKFFDRCIAESEEFFKQLPSNYDENEFQSVVASAIERFLINRGCILTKDKFLHSEISIYLENMKMHIIRGHREALMELDEN